MQNVAKKQSATFTMAFLFVSMVITPLSLKVLGISPSLSAGVEAWRRIASTFADNQQPLNAAELLALNLTPAESPREEVMPFASRLLASAQPQDVPLSVAPAASADGGVAGSAAVVAPASARCAKSIRLAPRVAPSAPMASSAVLPLEGIRAVNLPGTEAVKVFMPIRRDAMQSYARAMATYRFHLDETLKEVSKEFNVVTIKVKPPVLPALPAITNCAARKALTPEKVKQLRAAAWSLAFEDAAAEAAEKSEL
jgi:hypothetical protein